MNQLESIAHQERLADLFKKWAGEQCLTCEPLGANGSNRLYYRMKGATQGCIGAYNPDKRENKAFCYYSKEFTQLGLPVPELYAEGEDGEIYLQQDLGDHTLYEKLQQDKSFGEELVKLYQQVLSDLVRFQIGGKNLDFSYAYPRGAFDHQSMQWDLNYFKYYFLKTSSVGFDEQLLEDDFQTLIQYLLEENCSYFMYRDFQARNIMLIDGKPIYIDYQGARKGAAQYDVASLLYSAKSEIPEERRTELLNYYIEQLSAKVDIDIDKFREHFYGYVLIRILQAMGAYGFRGYFERKEYFLQSVPLAKNNLRNLLINHPLPINISYLNKTLIRLTESI